MKRIILLALFATLSMSSMTFAATCNPTELSKTVMDKMVKLQQTPDKFLAIEKPLGAQLDKLDQIQKTGDIDAFCKALDDMNKLLDDAAK